MCAGTGFAECVFVFRRPDGATLRIVTRGEELKDLSVYRVIRGRSENRGRPRRWRACRYVHRHRRTEL